MGDSHAAGRLPPKPAKNGEEHKGRCVTFCAALSGGPRHQGPPPGVFYFVRPRRGRTRTDYFPRPKGPGGRLEDYLGIRPLLGPALGLWFHSGLYGSILASVWPMVPFRLHSGPWFRFGLLVKSCAKQRRPRPEHTGGGICLAQILYKRGLLIRLQKRKIISEENLIVRWS